jgi:hypothetical protein
VEAKLSQWCNFEATVTRKVRFLKTKSTRRVCVDKIATRMVQFSDQTGYQQGAGFEVTPEGCVGDKIVTRMVQF